MPEETRKKNRIPIQIGITEVLYLAGLLSLASGICLLFGFEWSLIAVGLFLVRTAENNAREREGIK